MRHRHAKVEGSLRGAKRARSIALDNQQRRRRRKVRAKRPPNARHMRIGLGEAGAFEGDPWQMAEAVIGKVEPGMLAGEDDAAAKARGGEGRSNRR